MDLPDDIALRFAVCEAAADPPLDVLSAEERARLSGFGSAKRRREFALGRDVARRLLAEQVGTPPEAVSLRVAEDGAPETETGHLSIAHASTDDRTLAAAAVSPLPVGVDLEVVRPRRPDLYRRILHPDEHGLIETLPFEHDAAQVLVWTLKEAALKAMRTGFRVSPQALRFVVPPFEGMAVLRHEGALWDLQFAEVEGCFVAVAFGTAP
ncbi:MAG: 4'-phosphopantetheinyl transferase superfamily protein [Bacteroidota bacterium]